VDEDKIILKKYEPCCLFCGEGDNVVVFRDKKVCKKCLAEMQAKL
jgi:transcriptional pleiotropic regulator of transition state genes